ncbi:MAG TPA: NAD-dependent epimerase/dehydratase family protein [Terriglobales bacterium]
MNVFPQPPNDMTAKPTVLITGVSGKVGSHLLSQLEDYQVIGVDVQAPAAADAMFRFETIDLAEERSCDQLLELIRAYRPEAVAHLAFVTRQPQNGATDPQNMWSSNVVGTSRVIEAIAEHNRTIGGVEKFIFSSSAAVYGPEPQPPVREESPLQAQSLPYALQQQEADQTVQSRAGELRKCKTYVLRPHVYAGALASNYMLDMLRGLPGTRRSLGRRLGRRGVRLPLIVSSRGNNLDHKYQFVHLGDMARLIANIVRRKQVDDPLTLLNVAGRGDPLSLRRCAEIAAIQIKQLPTRSLGLRTLRLLWDLGVSDIPPAALPYLYGSCALDTSRLRIFLGENYRSAIQHTSEEALIESLKPRAAEETAGVPGEPVNA